MTAEIGEMVVLMKKGRLAALEARALEVAKDYPEAAPVWQLLGTALVLQDKDARHAWQTVTLLSPTDAVAHNNLGNAFARGGRLDDAVASYCRAIGLQPDLVEAQGNLGAALRGLGRLDEAAACYRRVLAMRPDDAATHAILADVLLSLGRLDDAVAGYRRALAIRPDFAEAHGSLGTALRLQGRTAEAEASCRRALDLNPHLVAALGALAELQADRGRFSEAAALFDQALSLDPDSAEMCAGLARIRKMTAGDVAWLATARRIAALPLPPSRELHLRYAIGKYFDDVGDYGAAFEQYHRANELTKRCRGPHDRLALSRAVDHRIEDRGWTRILPDPSDRPVFVVGMLRSGTSLAEQILASHPAVVGVGELPFWNDAVPSELLAGNYLRLLADRAGAARRVVNKMPTDFLFLGLIHAALPNARIIHMRRHPVDTCLSIYFQRFETALSYANDLDDLRHYYGEYARIMRHWHLTLPQGTILDVPYEALVDDPEAWSRTMLDFIGLDWDPRCLEFDRTERTVITASKWQVRQKINKASVGRWRNYAKFAGPLLDLMDSGVGS